MSGILRLGWHSECSLYVLNAEKVGCRKSGSAEGVVRRLWEQFAYSNGVELSPDGEMVWVANFAAKEVISLPAITAKSPFATTYLYSRTEGGVGPDGMRADKSGRLFVANLGAGEVLVFNPNAQLMGSIRLPASAGLLTSNVALGKSYLYIAEANKGEVWRVKLRK
jgi:sugar lactone lactonase YvrE